MTTETNLLATKIVGWSDAELEYSPPLDIFTSAEDREQVEERLNKQGIYFKPVLSPTAEWHGWHIVDEFKITKGLKPTWYLSKTEAIAAAVESLRGEYDD